MTVTESILWGLLAVCGLFVVFNFIWWLRFKPSNPLYLETPIKPIVTIYTFKDGTKIYDTGDGKMEIEHPNQEEKK